MAILEEPLIQLKWQTALRDDPCLWVVPGSHVRRNTGEEDRQLIDNVHAPLDSALQTYLNAGDGVAYILPILHWGSNYSTKMRRTMHGRFARLTHYSDPRWLPHLLASAQETFTRWRRRSEAIHGGCSSSVACSD